MRFSVRFRVRFKVMYILGSALWLQLGFGLGLGKVLVSFRLLFWVRNSVRFRTMVRIRLGLGVWPDLIHYLGVIEVRNF